MKLLNYMVLILVLLDITRGSVNKEFSNEFSLCLNPCFIGYYTWISIKDGEKTPVTVLILVLLDITRGFLYGIFWCYNLRS